MKSKITLLGCIVLAIQGCSSNYTCSQFPDTGCQPVSEVYEKTNGGLNDYRTDFYKGGDSESEGSLRDGRDPAKLELNIGQANRALNYVTPGDPILTKPVIMRVLFNSWEDSEKDLDAGGFVYIRLRDSEWVMQQ